jgi:Tol biopolymer transport system component/serine/threonine protein kinase
MDRARFQKVDELLDGALDHPPEERSRWLQERCSGDGDLRREVERLLALAEAEDDRLRPDGAFAGIIFEEVARELDRGSGLRQIEVGDQLGPYRVVELLGKGGMGRVYSAEDGKLGRRVALKVLPPELASAERRKRFETEARAVAALNHPNIVHLYSIEEEEGIFFLTMELVTGATLGDTIPEGGLPLKKFFQIAIPIADALATAHERGVVHRDLKPGNVMIGGDGRVKVLDFGLAKLDAEGAPRGEDSATQEGHVLGTVSHMSPEQAEGGSVDHRSDIFSFGVILYEMCTGRLPFTGGSPAAVLSSILKDTPAAVTDVNPRLPRDLSRVIKRCLAKDPERRYQTAVDVRTELEELEYELDSRKLFQPALEREASSRRVWVIAAAVIVAAGGVLLFALGRQEKSVDIASGSFSQLTTDAGVELFPTLSPDGGFLAYSSRQGDEDWDVYLLRAGGQRAINLTEDSPADDVQPAFSPDGRQIAFRSSRDDGGLFVMGATGESARRLTTFGWNPGWSPDGKKLVFAAEPISRTPFDRPTTSALWTVDVATGELHRLSEGDAVQPSWSPGGRRIAYWGLAEGGAQRDLYTIPAGGGEPRAVTRDAAVDWSPVWSPDGKYLYFSSDRGGSMNLWRIGIDERSGETQGPPEPVRAPATFVAHLSFSRDGRSLVYASTLTTQTLEVLDFDPATARIGGAVPLTRSVRAFANPRVSPDRQWIVGSRESPEDIVLVRMDGSDQRLVTDDPHRDRVPRWSPDGSRVAFYSNRSGKYEIWSVKPDGSDLERLTDLPEQPTRYPIWSPDGKKLLFSSRDTTGFIIDPDVPWSEQTPEILPPYPSERSEFVPMDWSPDGETLVGYLQSKSGVRSGLATYSLSTRGFEEILNFGVFPVWLPDGRRILFQALGPGRARDPAHYEPDFKLFVVDRVTKEFREVLAIPGASIDTPALSPDGRTLVFVRVSVDSDIWMLSAVPEEGRTGGAGF